MMMKPLNRRQLMGEDYTATHNLPRGAEVCPTCGVARERIEDLKLTCDAAKRMTGRKNLHILSNEGDKLKPRREK